MKLTQGISLFILLASIGLLSPEVKAHSQEISRQELALKKKEISDQNNWKSLNYAFESSDLQAEAIFISLHKQMWKLISVRIEVLSSIKLISSCSMCFSFENPNRLSFLSTYSQTSEEDPFKTS